ncbi:hypothetical protein K1W69_12020 [Hoeflea sp. WL0058]|uniref:Uncharacterized protein n=1 Tax=Flavimaribacter sediminis TaxID=2865987 RepID=A0AAE2ZNP8_9HYPH|nr:hypothetical protein [Flavimaribacter sediminis]MBW8637915.1 hypothetical protein [Flavimaribacter sediminis]
MKEKPSQTELIVRALMHGLTTYAFDYLIYKSTNDNFSELKLENADGTAILTDVFIDEILWSIPIAFVLAVLWIYSANRKWLTRMLQMIGATKRYGGEDVWDFIFNSSRVAVEYVRVRDWEKNVVYAEWVNTFSETGQLRQLVLRDVAMYYEDNMFEAPLIYIARDPKDMHIEFPYKNRSMHDG